MILLVQYFALAIQGYIRKLDEFIRSKAMAESKYFTYNFFANH